MYGSMSGGRDCADYRQGTEAAEQADEGWEVQEVLKRLRLYMKIAF